MTFVITQPCIDTADQSCVEVCPVDCIHFEQGTDRMLYINPAECIDCGACQPACPVSAIFPLADVPADQQRFTAINELWYTDPAAARAQVGSGAGAPASGEAAPAAVAAPAATAPAAASAPVAAAAPAAVAAPAPATSQLPVEAEAALHGAVRVPHYRLPSPMGFVMLLGVIAGWVLIILFPGPRLLQIGSGLSITPPIGPTIAWDGGLSAGFLLGLPVLLFFLGGFLDSQRRELGRFAARQPRAIERWREGRTTWRRSEETRRVDQQRAVHALAGTRFAFPTPQHPKYRTYVNVPHPTMALEFGGGGGDKVFPDILVVEYPGNYPVMVAQVETRETVSRQQAEQVWKSLESEEAPLYIYVPSGLGAVAKDYVRAAGIKHARVRTWRRQPDGVIVQEI